jgi:hypothetical protein
VVRPALLDAHGWRGVPITRASGAGADAPIALHTIPADDRRGLGARECRLCLNPLKVLQRHPSRRVRVKRPRQIEKHLEQITDMFLTWQTPVPCEGHIPGRGI